MNKVGWRVAAIFLVASAGQVVFVPTVTVVPAILDPRNPVIFVAACGVGGHISKGD